MSLFEEEVSNLLMEVDAVIKVFKNPTCFAAEVDMKGMNRMKGQVKATNNKLLPWETMIV